jgi:dGTPase
MPLNRFYTEFDTAHWEQTRPFSDPHRTPFQVDRDRILHSAALRRLQGKTQVFYSFLDVDYDFYRTRLTHSLEVAQIGRSICSWLAQSDSRLRDEGCEIDADLVEAASLAHDLGHPPFGHTGERALHRFMATYGGFEGNAQTLRMLTQLLFSENNAGMNPTRALIDTVLKYKTLQTELPAAENHYLYDDQASVRSFVMNGLTFTDALPPGKLRDSYRSIECQIMDWADDTAYSINDLADSIQTGSITIAKLESWAGNQSLAPSEVGHVEFLIKAMRDQRVEARLGRTIGEHIRGCSLTPRGPHLLQGLTRRFDFELTIDPAVHVRVDVNKRIARELVFQTPQLQQLDYKAEFVLERLFEALRDCYIEPVKSRPWHLLPPEMEARLQKAEGETGRARLICDWIANMTESTALRTYRRLFSPELGSRPDLI